MVTRLLAHEAGRSDGEQGFSADKARGVVGAALGAVRRAADAAVGEVIELARSGAVRAHVERFPLDRVDEAYERMRDGTLAGRAVICPHD